MDGGGRGGQSVATPLIGDDRFDRADSAAASRATTGVGERTTTAVAGRCSGRNCGPSTAPFARQ